MNCEEISTVIPRYMAGESDAAEAVAIEEHLASCRQCAAELEADQRVDACLREAMLEDEPDASAVIRHVVARMEHLPWWQRYFNVGMVRFGRWRSGIAGLRCGTRRVRPSGRKEHCHGCRSRPLHGFGGTQAHGLGL